MIEINDLRLFRESDFYLVPLCLLFLYGISIFVKRKYRGTEINNLFYPALNFRFLFALIYALVIQLYYGYGDSITFFRGVQDMHTAVGDDVSILSEIIFSSKANAADRLYPYFMYDGPSYTNLYMETPSNYMVSKFALPFSLLFNRSYFCISLCISFFSFGGTWRLFKLFYELYPQLRKKLAIAVLFLPSVMFWGSGFLKDSICIGALGYMLYAMYSIFMRRRKILASLIILTLMSILIFTVKPYIILGVLGAVFIWIFMELRSRIRDRNLRRLASVIFFVAGSGLAFFAIRSLASFELAERFSSERILASFQQQQESSISAGGTIFSIGTVDMSVGSLILLFPSGIVATFFRPFIWEVSNPMMLLSGIEAIGFLVLTIMAFSRIGFRRFFSIAFSDPAIVFCMVFSVLFGGMVGISTNNFGALVRYRIPVLPFYLIMVFVVMHKSGLFSPRYVFSKKLF
jgi:hypothetical protein